MSAPGSRPELPEGERPENTLPPEVVERVQADAAARQKQIDAERAAQPQPQ